MNNARASRMQSQTCLNSAEAKPRGDEVNEGSSSVFVDFYNRCLQNYKDYPNFAAEKQ